MQANWRLKTWIKWHYKLQVPPYVILFRCVVYVTMTEKKCKAKETKVQMCRVVSDDAFFHHTSVDFCLIILLLAFMHFDYCTLVFQFNIILLTSFFFVLCCWIKYNQSASYAYSFVALLSLHCSPRDCLVLFNSALFCLNKQKKNLNVSFVIGQMWWACALL